MNKRNLLAQFLLLSIVIFSCGKNPPAGNPRSSGLVGSARLILDTVPSFSADTCGAYHNTLLNEYYNSQGIDSASRDTTRYSDVFTMVYAITAIFIDDVHADEDSLEALVNETMAEYRTMGLFNADSTIKPMDSVNAIFIRQMSNTNVRAVWNYVASHDFNTFADQYDYTENALQAIGGLSMCERWANDGGLSVMTHSYALFLGKTEMEIAKDVARADAWAFAQYWNATNTLFWWAMGLNARMAYCELKASYFSGLQLKLRLEKG